MSEIITEYLPYIKFISFAVNGMIFFIWLKKKFVQNLFLSGRWEGTLLCIDDEKKLNQNVTLECMLVITKHNKRDNRAILYYEQRRIAGRRVIKGVDRLHSYEEDTWFINNRKWNPKFMRLLHFDNQFDDEWNDKEINLHKIYDWDCEVCSLFFKEQMKVTIKGEDVTFEGKLQKV